MHNVELSLRSNVAFYIQRLRCLYHFEHLVVLLKESAEKLNNCWIYSHTDGNAYILLCLVWEHQSPFNCCTRLITLITSPASTCQRWVGQPNPGGFHSPRQRHHRVAGKEGCKADRQSKLVCSEEDDSWGPPKAEEISHKDGRELVRLLWHKGICH